MRLLAWLYFRRVLQAVTSEDSAEVVSKSPISKNLLRKKSQLTTLAGKILGGRFFLNIFQVSRFLLERKFESCSRSSPRSERE